MDLLVPGIIHPDFSTEDYIALMFSGPVPETEADIPFDTSDYFNMVQAPEFVGAKCYSSTTLNRGRSGKDGCVLSPDNDYSDTFVVPFGHITPYNSNEIMHHPKTWNYIVPEDETLNSLLTSGYSGTYSYKYLNPLAATDSTQYNSTSFGMRFGTSNSTDFVHGTHGIELNFDSKFVLSKQYLSAMAPASYYLKITVSGWDYDTESWVELYRRSQISQNSNEWIQLESNTLNTDKYFVSTYSSYNGNTTYPGVTNLWFISKAEDYVAPEVAPEQPTWLILLSKNITGKTRPAFAWGSCSGPTGNGEFKLNNDQYEIGDTIHVLTREFEVFSIFEGVSNEA